MEEKAELKDRFKSLLDHYGLSPDSLSKKIGGSRGTYFSIQSGKSKPDYTTSENILMNFPEISAEWWFRGTGPMMKADVTPYEEVIRIKNEYQALQGMFERVSLQKARLEGKSKDVKPSPGRAKFENDIARDAVRAARKRGAMSRSGAMPVHVQESTLSRIYR